MSRLFARSVLVLALLFGMVFAVGTGVLYYYNVPVIYAVFLAVGMVFLQFALGPYLIDWIFKINWGKPEDISPEFAAFLADLCNKRNIPVPRFGIIEDGNPNAFTYGHVPGDARLVVTRGIIEMLDPEEFNAVVAHEVGHITHYDFVVMTMASVVPMVLYLLYVWTRDERKNGGYAAAVAFGAYAAYIVSQYIVLFLSRVREYFADEHAATSVTSANSISTALVKIAYGLARIPQVEQKEEGDKKKKRAKSFNPARQMGSLGICNFSSSSPMAMYSTTTTGEFSPDLMFKAMQWDLLNPWARFYEFQSTHPLVARRVQAASRIAVSRGETPQVAVAKDQTKPSYWRAFWTDVCFAAVPYVGLLIGLAAAFAQIGSFSFSEAGALKVVSSCGLALILAGIGWVVRLSYSYASDYKQRTVVDLVGEVEVSHIHCIPVELEGQVIGRGVPGLFWSKDLVIQDETGFITMIYRQPLGILETLFGIFKAGKFDGEKGTFRGWYRRGPIPYLELKEAEFEDGRKLRCHYNTFLWVCAISTTMTGLLLYAAQMAH